MIDHTGVSVSHFEASKAFYETTLAVLGYKLICEFCVSGGDQPDVAGFGEDVLADFWISRDQPNRPGIHVAFRAGSRALVDAFYEAALKAGGTDNGAPGLRPQYHSNYYGAFVFDPDGHNIEAVCHTPE